MNVRELSVSFLLLGLSLAAGCRHPAPVAAPPPPALQNLVVLLPNEDGSTGSIVVSNAAGSRQLTEANTAVNIERTDAAPGQPFLMQPDEMKRIFGSTIAFLPSAEERFTLYFSLGGTQLTAESTDLLPRIAEAYKARGSTDVAIIGHTDTTGDKAGNFRLGLARAEEVGRLIEALGVNRAHLSTESHGAGDLLVPTGENVAEPRNRRVEVIVR